MHIEITNKIIFFCLFSFHIHDCYYDYDDIRTLNERPVLSDEWKWDSQEEETTIETYSPISSSPNQDTKKKILGFCSEEFRISVSGLANGVLWSLSDFAKAGKLLKSPSMAVEFYDEYEMRKVYSLIYDVFRCKYLLRKLVLINIIWGCQMRVFSLNLHKGSFAFLAVDEFSIFQFLTPIKHDPSLS